jgi:hypothetical protein
MLTSKVNICTDGGTIGAGSEIPALVKAPRIINVIHDLKEIWKDVEGFEGIYKVSNYGRLKSYKKNKKNGYILSYVNKKGGYLSVILTDKHKNKYTKMHRLVASAFVPNPFAKTNVNHIDGNKQNNISTNLEWVTPKENTAHAIQLGLVSLEGLIHYNQIIRPKSVMQFTLDGRYINTFVNCKVASDKTGVCYRNIHQVASKTENKCGKTRKQAGGYVWKFREER